MQFDIIIKGGTVVTAAETMPNTDVGIAGEKIAAVGTGLAKQASAGRVIDAKGKYVIPGGMDVHVHLDMPFMGSCSCDDYDSGHRGAAKGCVTTTIDFALPYGQDSLNQSLDNWMERAKKACVDYTFHSAISDFKRHGKEMKSIVDRGVPTFKEFMIYANMGWQSDDDAIFATLERCRELGAMLLMHAESSKVLDLIVERHRTPELMKKFKARLHTMTRPHYIEYEAIQRAVTWCEVTGGKLYIVHMSTRQGTEIIKAAQERGVPVLAETCAQYLVLNDDVFKRPDGHLFACQPQLKRPEDTERLWKGIAEGTVCNVSTDTCSFTKAQKAIWNGDWNKIPMGLPGLETLLPVVYTEGVLGKRISLNRFVEVCCASPAKTMNLYPRKGTIAPGSDADVAIFDPKNKKKVDHKKLETKCDWYPLQGMELAGFAECTLCRGRVIVENSKFVGENGYGKFLKREPFDY
ncbi:dihydropyrimidinase [Candidatus Poribacteria bacterium]|nr:dihydropyrimidinase [Candidatus Poribacteria bacterium]